MERHITLPLTREEARTIKSGEQLLLSGVIYTARDAAHKRLCELVEKGEPLPFDVKNATIYYVGPTPAKPGQVIGSAGPTTSYRMDAYSPTLIREGETGMIGKGKRNAEVIDAMKKYGAVYFAAIGGAGALLSSCIKKAEIIAYEDLGAEALRRLEVENFPVVAVISEEWASNVYMKRNRYMVGQADRVIAVYDGREKGGTVSTIRMVHAQRKEMREVPVGSYLPESMINLGYFRNASGR